MSFGGPPFYPPGPPPFWARRPMFCPPPHPATGSGRGTWAPRPQFAQPRHRGVFRYPRGPQPILPPPPPPPPLEKEEPAESLKRKSEEKPSSVAKVLKTESSSSEYCRFNQVWAETYDRPLPSELLSQCRPLMCDLCSVKLNSPVQAKMHYEGKSHDKRARHFLQSWALQSKQGIPIKKKDQEIIESAAEITQPVPPTLELSTPMVGRSNLYCQTCDLSFTSNAHATQHYEGKNHAKKVKAGYLNPSSENPSQNPDSFASVSGGVNPFFCQVCCVNATSQPQLDTHLQGRNHKNKVAKLNSKNPLMTSQVVAPKAAAPVVAVKKENYNIYRTPSGQFYCAPCNLCVDTELQFGQHLESRKHKQKSGSKKSERKF